jgi:preprotein translocase YajC subunit
MSNFTTLGLIALMAIAFYFLIMRPQRKRQQDVQRTMNSLTPGTRVMTGSGLFGTVTAIGAKQAVLEIAPGVELTVLKQAVTRVVGPADEDQPAEDVMGPPGEFRDHDLDLPPVRTDYGMPPGPSDLGPSATDVTPPVREQDQAPWTDPSAKE